LQLKLNPAITALGATPELLELRTRTFRPPKNLRDGWIGLSAS
jgi:hypothetical protein